MKVDVVRMRSLGEELSKEQVRSTRATRGELTIARRLEGRAGSVRIALLAAGERNQLLIPALDRVQIGPLRGNSFVLMGIEEVGERKTVSTYPQSWWCRLVMPEGAAAGLFGYSDDDDESASGDAVMLDAPQWRG